MKIISSKYKIFGGFALLIVLNLLWFSITWKIILALIEKFSLPNYAWKVSDFVISGIVILFQVFLLRMLMKDCRYIKIDDEKIIFINPVLPFIQATRYWNDFDCRYTVMEYSRSGYHEAIWLVKNKKLKYRISSFYYANYKELKDSIVVKNNGRLRIGKFKQLACLLGMKI